LDKNYSVDFDFRYIAKTIMKRWYIALAIAVLAFGFSIYKGYHKVAIIYEAKTSLIVGNPIGGEGTKYQIAEVQLYERFVQTYSALARTSFIAEKVSNKLNKALPSEAIQGSIIVTPQANTQFIDVRIKWGNPQQAVEILNTFSEVFIAEAKSIYPTCNIEIIEKTKEPRAIVLSKRIYVYISPIVGIILSILIIFGIELLDNTIKTEEDVKEYLNLSVVGEIPVDKKLSDKVTPETMKKLNSGMIEAFRTLRTSVEFVTNCNSLKSIMITSAVPSEGKTLISSLLAAVLAHTGKRAVLVDCDLRNPNVHKTFRNTNDVGLSNYLVGKALISEIINKSSIDNLSIITSGIRYSNPSELLELQSMKTLMRSLRNDYDYIILDTPPVGLVTDAQIIAQIADGCMLVVSSGKSVKEDTIKAKELLRNVGGKMLGVVLNKIKDSRFSKKYSYYYTSSNKNSEGIGV
jgi:polysaccharide biosynthesis transport protein